MVNLTNLVGSPGTIADAQGVGTITDNDPVPVLSVNDVSVSEGNAGTTTATFTVTLSAASGRAVTFQWATAAGSATAGTDYVSASGSRTIAAGTTTAPVGITVNGDFADELDETFGLTLSNPGNATIGDGSGLATVSDDDPIPVLSINDISVTEGNAGTATATFTVSLSAASGKAVTFDWATAPGSATAGTDYASATGSRTIAAGATTATVGITVNGDVLDEANETFDVTLSNPGNATIGDGSGVATITDDDAAPTLSVNDVHGGGRQRRRRDRHLHGHPIVGECEPRDVRLGHHLRLRNGRHGLRRRERQQDHRRRRDDRHVHRDRQWRRRWTRPTRRSASRFPTPGTPRSQTAPAWGRSPTTTPPRPCRSTTSPITEGNAGTTTATYTVTLSAASGQAVTFDWATAAGSATAGTDYVAANGSRTSRPGPRPRRSPSP